MRTLYIDCIAGASGDMLLGALVDLGVEIEALQTALDGLHLPGFKLAAAQVSKNGIGATKVNVIVEDHKTERHVPEIIAIIEASTLPESVKAQAVKVVERLGEVEGRIHQAPPEEVHLHELGGVDTIVDVCGFLLGLEMLEVEKVVCSPLPLGRGFTQSAHGRIPVPAPATLALLSGVPVRGTEIEMELVTPTGAALLSTFAQSFGAAPDMKLTAVGYGAGSRDLEIPNVVRMLLGDDQAPGERMVFKLTLLETNIDDMSPETYGYLMDRLYAAGARDVTLIPVYMKKNRPGTMLQVACSARRVEEIKQIIFAETSTLGIRQLSVTRDCLPREIVTVGTVYGEVRVKVADLGGGKHKAAPEFEDCKALAEAHGVPLRAVMTAAMRAWEER